MLYDAHCHFHGGLPAGWLADEIMSEGDPCGVSEAVKKGRRKLIAMLKKQKRGDPASLVAAQSAFFSLYALIERHCRWMEFEGRGSRDLYNRGAVALREQASSAGVGCTRMFFSLTSNCSQMRERLIGLMGAHVSCGDALKLRLTIPRSRSLWRFYKPSEVAELLFPAVECGALVGLDVSGLDSECPARETLDTVDWLIQLRSEVGPAGVGLPISVHWGENVCPEGVDATLWLVERLRLRGVDSLGHGILLWDPAVVCGAHPAACSEILRALRASGVSFEICPTVAELYGCRRDSDGALHGVAQLAGNLVMGTDAPGILGYQGLSPPCR